MQKLLFRILKFAVLIIVFLGANYMVNSYFIKSKPYKIKKEKSVLILGDSHPMSGCDPKEIENSKNISVGGEPYFVSFHKLKYLVQHNKHLKTIILGFAYHNTSSFNDVKLSTGAGAKSLMENNYSLFSYSDLKNVTSDKKKYTNAILHNMMLYPKMKHYGYIGRFKRDKAELIDKVSVDGPIKRHYTVDGKPADISIDNLSHLDQIVEFCLKKDLKLYLVNTPLHEDYRNLTEKKYIETYDKKSADYDKLNNITVLDYSNMELADSLFRNHDHVNAKGAKVVSQAINKVLQENSKN